MLNSGWISRAQNAARAEQCGASVARIGADQTRYKKQREIEEKIEAGREDVVEEEGKILLGGIERNWATWTSLWCNRVGAERARGVRTCTRQRKRSTSVEVGGQ